MTITRREFVTQMGVGAAIVAGAPALHPSCSLGRPQGWSFPPSQPCKIRVIGVGGAGTLILDRMAEVGQAGIDLIAVDTDAQNLWSRRAGAKLLIGKTVTRGLGAGPDYGGRAAEESLERLHPLLSGADLVVVVAGMGGGTGTGAARVVAEVARRLGAMMTLGVVSLPFAFEGRRRRRQGAAGVRELACRLDTTVVVPNDALVPPADHGILFRDAFGRVDELMLQATQSLTVPLVQPGLINVRFSDYRELFVPGGRALVATCVNDGEHRARRAAHALLEHPVLDGVDLRGASSVLVTIATGASDDDLTVGEIDEIGTVLCGRLGDAVIALTNVRDPMLATGCRVTLTAVGLGKTDHGRTISR